MQEQRDIAEYFNEKSGNEYKIIDFSKADENLLVLESLRKYSDEEKLIIINFQEIGLAPYCDHDEVATITLEDKIRAYQKLKYSEFYLLNAINMSRDSFFAKGNRKVIIGMHPMFYDKMLHQPYYDAIGDLLDFVRIEYKFNKDKAFEYFPDNYFRENNGKLDEDEVHATDDIQVYNGRIIRISEDMRRKLSSCSDEEYNDIMSTLPEISFEKQKNKKF